ncbi:hypothetical protein KJ636_04755, partial [Patescibacteria group bacterium]|nr:hypothetical protein [Patescibacteria group bacterium]
MSITSKTKITALLIFSFFLLPLAIKADTFGQKTNFFVDSSYDLSNREKISAVLLGLSPKLYFYVDEDWWNLQNIYQQADVKNSINFLAAEFENKIYPTLTSTFGSEPKPGIDNDERLTILIHQMKEEAGGYFNNGDEYSKLENPKSNEREMVYLNTNYLKFDIIKSYLAHEFTHLITFNQKDKIQGVSEDVWLNEARADYSPTLLGYDQDFQGSNLQQRVKQFITSPNDSLTEWQNQKADYGVVYLWTQYLVDHYGIAILSDSLKSKKVGIESINEALKKNGFSEDFSQTFTDWTMAVFLNDCKINQKYCYLREHLKNIRITPYIYFLPLAGESNLSTGYFIKEWSGNWQKIVGGKGTLTLEVDGEDDANFKVLYIVCDFQEKCELQ